MKSKYILIGSLLILIIIFYNVSENFDINRQNCDENCGKYNNTNNKLDNKTEINNCLNCENCGVCTLGDNSKTCTNGTRDGPIFLQNCVKWIYGKENMGKNNRCRS